MTIAALLRLLDEIDSQGGPQAARDDNLHLPSERARRMTSTVTETTTPAAPDVAISLRPTSVDRDAETMPVGQLIAWGVQHDDPAVQEAAETVRSTLTRLRQRYASDQELSAITTEEQQLEQRLAEIRSRREELEPRSKARRGKKAAEPRDYEPAVVRAWAREHGMRCPERGRVPADIVAAWRATQVPEPVAS
ncbi:histone-like nucleoid-structuring protein Lsr2 [Streptomyces sp. NPDC058299]|uniref:Lsr2 family DNA-binding protein n=1 Tax=Streptomyces sp. NPDC058299 TaxID=3346435 RepID=UPI0036DFB853